MRKTLGAFLSLLLILTAVACNNNLESSTTSLTINVSDTATKVIAYDPADGYPGQTGGGSRTVPASVFSTGPPRTSPGSAEG